MTEQAEQAGVAHFRQVMEDLAASRGISLEEMAHRANASGASPGEITPEGLRGEREDEPPFNFGGALAAALEMSMEERVRVAEAYYWLIFGEPYSVEEAESAH